ncbi:MAG: NAD(P)H-hydrate dehydratase [Phycisphaeraceae bacterium]
MTNANDQARRVPAPPARPKGAHKGTFGTVIVVGGSRTMIGAPAMCATAALRSGAGLVRIATEERVLHPALSIEPGATGVLLRGTVDQKLSALDSAGSGQRTVLAVGPGIGQAPEAGDLVGALLRGSRPMVLDADGLNLLAWTGRPRPGREAEVVLTPHPGEFKRLAEPLGIRESATDPDQRPAAAAKLARAHQAVVVLKGERSVITDGERTFVNDTGNPALAAAGSGDVLTGVIAALIAQGMGAFEAAALGAHVHGLAADRWAERHGPRGLLARELADELVGALRAVEQ